MYYLLTVLTAAFTVLMIAQVAIRRGHHPEWRVVGILLIVVLIYATSILYMKARTEDTHIHSNR